MLHPPSPHSPPLVHQLAELDLDYEARYSGLRIPPAYERLLLAAVRGDQRNFVRKDFIEQAWALFDPALKALEADKGARPVLYKAGTRGPAEGDELCAREGFTRTEVRRGKILHFCCF